MSFYTISVHGGGDPSGSFVTLLDDLLGAITESADQYELAPQILPGISVLSSNIHPMVVHFPIALLTTYFVLDLIGMLTQRQFLRFVARWMLYLGAVGAITAVATGLIAASTVSHGLKAHEIMETHEKFGLTIAGLSMILAIWRRISGEPLSQMASAFQLILSSILLTCIVFGADLGGLMVYGHGVGVQSVSQGNDHHHHGTLPDAETHANRNVEKSGF